MKHTFHNVIANFPNIASRSTWQGKKGSYNIGLKYHRVDQRTIDDDVMMIFSNLKVEGHSSGKITKAPLPSNTPLTILDDKYPDKYWAKGYNLIKAHSRDKVPCYTSDNQDLKDLEDITHGSTIDCAVDFSIYTDKEGEARISAKLLGILLITSYVKNPFLDDDI